jgi:hypothetical protein
MAETPSCRDKVVKLAKDPTFIDNTCGCCTLVLAVISILAMLITCEAKWQQSMEHLVPVGKGYLSEFFFHHNTCQEDKKEEFRSKCKDHMPAVFYNNKECINWLQHNASSKVWETMDKIGEPDLRSKFHQRVKKDEDMVKSLEAVMKKPMDSYQDGIVRPISFNTSTKNDDPGQIRFQFRHGPKDEIQRKWGQDLLRSILPEQCVDACTDSASKTPGMTPLMACNDEILVQAAGPGSICSNNVRALVVKGACNWLASAATVLPLLILLFGLMCFLLYSCLPFRKFMEWQTPTLLQQSTLHIYAIVVQFVIASNILLSITYESSSGVHSATDAGAKCQPLSNETIHPGAKSFECVANNGFSVGNVVKALSLIGGSAAIFPTTVDFLNRWCFRLLKEEIHDKELRCAPSTGGCCRLRIPNRVVKAFAFILSISICVFEQTFRMVYEVGQRVKGVTGWDPRSVKVFQPFDIFGWKPIYIDWPRLLDGSMVPSMAVKHAYLDLIPERDQDPIDILEIEIISKLPVILATACLLQKAYYWQDSASQYEILRGPVTWWKDHHFYKSKLPLGAVLGAVLGFLLGTIAGAVGLLGFLVLVGGSLGAGLGLLAANMGKPALLISSNLKKEEKDKLRCGKRCRLWTFRVLAWLGVLVLAGLGVFAGNKLYEALFPSTSKDSSTTTHQSGIFPDPLSLLAILFPTLTGWGMLGAMLGPVLGLMLLIFTPMEMLPEKLEEKVEAMKWCSEPIFGFPTFEEKGDNGAWQVKQKPEQFIVLDADGKVSGDGKPITFKPVHAKEKMDTEMQEEADVECCGNPLLGGVWLCSPKWVADDDQDDDPETQKILDSK